MLFKDKLVLLRKSKGLTQDEFASAVGVSRQAVYKWECGQSYPEVPKLLEMKLLLSISIDELLDDSYDIPIPEKKKRKRKPRSAAKVEETAAPAAEAVAEVKEEAAVAAVVEPEVEEVKAETAAAEAPKAEPVVEAAIEEPAVAEAPKAEPTREAPKAESADEKKGGFFSRLFGKK